MDCELKKMTKFLIHILEFKLNVFPYVCIGKPCICNVPPTCYMSGRGYGLQCMALPCIMHSRAIQCRLPIIICSYQCTLQLQFYQKSGKGCTVVVYSTPAIVNIIWWGHDCVVDHYTMFVPSKSVLSYLPTCLKAKAGQNL